MGCCCGKGAGGAPENFLKHVIKQGLLMHSEQIVKCVEVDTRLLCLCNVYPGNIEIEISMQISFEKRQSERLRSNMLTVPRNKL